MASFSPEIGATQWGVVIGTSLLAALLDIRTRRIPNALTISVALGGLAFGGVSAGLSGVGSSVLGLCVLALPYIALFLFAGGGAGDAKMMGAVGAWLGVQAGVVVLVAVAVVGGLFGLLNLAMAGQFGAGVRRIGASFYVMMIAVCSGRKGWAMIKPDPDRSVEVANQRLTMPYGPAIFIGVCIGAFLVHLWNG